MLYSMFSTDNNSYSYVVFVMTRTNTYDRSSLNDIFTIVENTQFVGGSFNYLTDFNNKIDISGIE